MAKRRSKKPSKAEQRAERKATHAAIARRAKEASRAQRSEALEAMSDPDRHRRKTNKMSTDGVLAEVQVQQIREDVAAPRHDWTPPVPRWRDDAADEKLRRTRENRQAAELETLLTSLEKQMKSRIKTRSKGARR